MYFQNEYNSAKREEIVTEESWNRVFGGATGSRGGEVRIKILIQRARV
jgi:hypothetical protein